MGAKKTKDIRLILAFIAQICIILINFLTIRGAFHLWLCPVLII